MAQSISLLGAEYSNVPAVELPKTGGGTASFTDVTDTTAAAEDVADGKYFYTAAGVRTLGTSQGGNMNGEGIYYGTCSTGASTQAKTATVEGVTEYYEGLNLRIKFSSNQTYNGVPTLNVNGLGAVNIRRVSGTNAARYEWVAGEVLDLIYDGTYFVLINGGFATTTYYGAAKLSSTMATSTGYAATPNLINTFATNTVTGLELYSSSATYEVGQKVRYGTFLYECNTAITTAESWNAEHWTVLPSLLEQIDDCNVFEVTTPSFTSLPKTFYNPNITANHRVAGNAVTLSNPQAGDLDWVVTCADGSFTISGTFHGSAATTASMGLWKPAKTFTAEFVQITSQPQNVSLSAGEEARFSVVASGSGLTYQWYSRSSSSGTWAQSGATGNQTANLSVWVNAGHNGYQFYCKITNSNGDSTNSAVATITII